MKLRILVSSILVAGTLLGAYTYYYSDTLTTINTTNWNQNGSVTATAGGLTATSANGGSLISKVSVPDGTSQYEVKTTLTLATSGGTYISYLRASTDAMSGPTPQGTYYSVELQNPTFSGSNCIATLVVNKRLNGAVSLVFQQPVYCINGMAIRSVIRNDGTILITCIAASMVIRLSDTSITAGKGGVGGLNMPAGNSIARADLGPLDTVGPQGVNVQSIGTSVFPTRVDAQWQGITDDAAGAGICFYENYRNLVFFQTENPATFTFSDAGVSASTSYNYRLFAVDCHNNYSPPANFTVTTPPAGAIDPRRVGVRPTGSYWGSAGEQVDSLSGNVNFTIPLFRAQGRGGTGVTIALSNNSQSWRLDPGGTWKLARDVGYGFGWRLMAGSLLPYWSDSVTIHHYIYTDATGAEYRLDQNNAGVWTSLEGIYVSYDANVNRLYFTDGSFWAISVISGGTEQDAGTMYPSIIEDTNGNQVLIRYNQGLGSPWPNTSARPSEVEDVRAVYNSGTGTYRSYTFTYNADAIPHLTQINNVIGKASESYTLSYLENQSLSSPFSPPVAFGTTVFLQSVNITTLNVGNQFQYDASGSGELAQATLPNGGHLRWVYTPFTFSGSRTQREVQTRYLAKASSGGTETAYAFTRNAGDSTLTVHSSLVLDDPSGIG